MAGGGFFKLSPRNEQVRVHSENPSEREMEFWRELCQGRNVIVLEPHPDDAAIAGDVTFRTMQAAGARLILITATIDHIGVTNEFAQEFLFGKNVPPGIAFSDAGLDLTKRTIRDRESYAYSNKGLKISDADHKGLNINLPHGTPQGPYLDSQLDALYPKAKQDMGDDQVRALQETMERFNQLENPDGSHRPPIWVLPYLYLRGPHHSHHQIINTVAVQKLREMYKNAKVQPIILFYETFEHASKFETDGVQPNLNVTFGEAEMGKKQQSINLYESQVARRQYDKLIEERNRSAHFTDNPTFKEENAYVERFLIGRLVRQNTVDELQGYSPMAELALLTPIVHATHWLATAAVLALAAWHFKPALAQLWNKLAAHFTNHFDRVPPKQANRNDEPSTWIPTPERHAPFIRERYEDQA
jgi:hypothetical protein